MTFLPASHSTNRIIDVHFTTLEEIWRTDGKSRGWRRERRERASCVNWENKRGLDLPVSWHSPILRGRKHSCLLRKHVGPLGGCPVCQMSSPALFQRKAFTGEYGVKTAPVLTGAHQSVTEVEISRRGSRGPLTTDVRRCSA